MLFHVTWEFIDTSEAGSKRSLTVFSKWQPPAGAEFKGFYGFSDGRGGVAIIEADSAATLFETTAPWVPWLRFSVDSDRADRGGDAARERGRRLPRSVGRLGTEGGVDELVGGDGVLAHLRLTQRRVVDLRRHAVDEPPLQARFASRRRRRPRCTGRGRSRAGARRRRSPRGAARPPARASP